MLGDLSVGVAPYDRALGDERLDVAARKAGFAKNFLTVFAETRRILPDRRRRFAPGCCRTGDAQRAFGRMFDGLKQSNRGEMRIVDQAVEVVQRRMA